MSIEDQLQRIADAFDKLVDIQVIQLEALEKYVHLVDGALKKFDSPPPSLKPLEKLGSASTSTPAFIPIPSPPGTIIFSPRPVKQLEKLTNNFGFSLLKSLRTIGENLQERRWKAGPNTFQMIAQQYGVSESEIHAVIKAHPALDTVFKLFPKTGYK